MYRYRPLAIAAPALIALLAITGCVPTAPADTAPPTPSQTDAPPVAPTPTATDPAAEPPASEPAATHDWVTYELGDGRTSWSQPADWTADISREAAGADGALADYRGVIRDDEGTPILRIEAVAEGQYASDGFPCERPETEVLEVTPMGDEVAVADAALVAVAFEQGGRVVFAAGISQNDAYEACEPGIIVLYDAGYDYLVFELVNDAGDAPPTFATFDDARAYVDSDEYAQIHDVLASFAAAP